MSPDAPQHVHWPDWHNPAMELADMSMFALAMPWPISFNSYKHGMYTSKKGRIWRDNMVALIWQQCGGRPEPLLGRIGLWQEIHPPDDARKRDLDNHTGKHIWDLLQKAGLMNDDSQVVEEHKYRMAKRGKGWLTIIIAEV